MEFVTFLLYLLLKRSLLLILLVGGIGFAIARWKRHPRVSLMTVLTLGLYLIETSLFSILYHWLPSYLFSLRFSPETIETIDSVLQLTDDFLYAAVLILLVAAAFTRRIQDSFTINQRTNNS
jgi:uncharacterized membrane protein